MIPKVIHYCWFGGNPLSDDARKCVASWRKYFPGYEIKEWNETNFDVNMTPYTASAYQARKYAFVSDFARMWILYRYGGLYFDTDVEAVRPFDDILSRGSFMGCEIDGGGVPPVAVNPGLGLGVEAGNPLIGRIVGYYRSHRFLLPDGSINPEAIVRITTAQLTRFGLLNKSGIQSVAGIIIYPKEYFNPFDDATGRLTITPLTHSIHWYSKTWMHVNPLRQKIARLAHRLFGSNTVAAVRHLLHLK